MINFITVENTKKDNNCKKSNNFNKYNDEKSNNFNKYNDFNNLSDKDKNLYKGNRLFYFLQKKIKCTKYNKQDKKLMTLLKSSIETKYRKILIHSVNNYLADPMLSPLRFHHYINSLGSYNTGYGYYIDLYDKNEAFKNIIDKIFTIKDDNNYFHNFEKLIILDYYELFNLLNMIEKISKINHDNNEFNKNILNNIEALSKDPLELFYLLKFNHNRYSYITQETVFLSFHLDNYNNSKGTNIVFSDENMGNIMNDMPDCFMSYLMFLRGNDMNEYMKSLDLLLNNKYSDKTSSEIIKDYYSILNSRDNEKYKDIANNKKFSDTQLKKIKYINDTIINNL